MIIDNSEKIDIWLLGNTGLRNPMRIRDGFIAFSHSRFIGNLHGRSNEIDFMRYLNEMGIINNELGKDESGSHARKWRLMFERYGLIYGQIKKRDGFSQDEYGGLDEITPFGHTFINATTLPDIQECFLRSLSVEQYALSDKTSYYSPFRWVLAIMLELEKRTGTSELSRIEFILWGQTTNPAYSLSNVVDQILDLRERRTKSSTKKAFDNKETSHRAINYDKMISNFKDYGDMNLRYLRASGILLRKGRGLIIDPSKHTIAVALAKSDLCADSRLNILRSLTNGAPLPTDNLEIGKKVLWELTDYLTTQRIKYDISDLPLNTPAEVNIARRYLENIISQTNEINYANEQKDKWKEISNYMTLLITGKSKLDDEDNYIEIPKDEMPAYLEWVLWRATLALGHLSNKPYEIRGFKLDSDFLPVSFASGGRGDLYCEFENYLILTEVTMSTSSRQEAMEGEPVRRHISDAVQKYSKPVYGLFIAIKVDTNTAETFRHGIWYTKDDEKQRLKIVPLSLSQFQIYFENLFKANLASPDRLIELLEDCSRQRDKMEAPDWKAYIDKAVRVAPITD